jgi:hypothetical protein
VGEIWRLVAAPGSARGGERSFVEACLNGEVAPISAISGTPIGRPKSTSSGHLADQGQLWADACARYGTGVPGYKRDLAVMFHRFFETSEPDPTLAAVGTRLTDAWMSTIIEPLIAATRGGTSIDQKDVAA